VWWGVGHRSGDGSRQHLLPNFGDIQWYLGAKYRNHEGLTDFFRLDGWGLVENYKSNGFSGLQQSRHETCAAMENNDGHGMFFRNAG
jgi:hypothetical protein